MKSSLKRPLPVTSRSSSARRTGWPMKRNSGFWFIIVPSGAAAWRPGAMPHLPRLQKNSMPGDHRGQPPRVFGRAVAAPGYVQIGPDEQEVAAVDGARLLVRDVEHAQRRLERGERLRQRRRLGRRAPEPQQREAELRSEEHTSELQSRPHLVCRLLLEKK